MPIYNITKLPSSHKFNNWNLDREMIESFNKVHDVKIEVDKLKIKNKALKKIKINDLLDYFDALGKHWIMAKGNNFLEEFGHFGISFLITFLKKKNLEQILNESLHGNLNCLDQFVDAPFLDKKIIAQPRGVVTHWLAGNVPVLGLISLVQGLISKNINIVKLPSQNGLVLPKMIAHIENFDFEKGSSIIKGTDITGSCILFYCEKDDKNGLAQLSLNSDTRVAWGGKEAVETVMTLPRKFGTEDIIFGPKYSFAVVGKNSFKFDDLRNITNNLALDASVFEQQGCNSPHTVFIEQGGDVSPLLFAQTLAKSMDDILKRVPKAPVTSTQAYEIVNIRAEYSMTSKVFKSKGTEWTIIFSNDKGLADACYSRVLFVRPVDDIEEVIQYIESNMHQSMGLCVENNKKLDFAQKASNKGIERITEIGKMSIYDHPWDGIFPIDRLIRWVSCYNNN